MSLARFCSALGAAAVATLFSLAAASAATVPITPGGSVTIQGNANYTYESVKPLPSNTSADDKFTFNYVGSHLALPQVFLSVSINPIGGFSGSFVSFVANWIDLTASVKTNFFTETFFSGGGGLIAPVIFGHSYMLEMLWTTGANNAASYHTTLSTGAGVIPAPTPLPPAAILFISALAGMGLLGRRRMKAAQQ